MKITNVYAMYFSATSTTKTIVAKIATIAAESLNSTVKVIDFTLPASREEVFTFTASDLVVLGVPVIAGRVPNLLLPFLKEKIVGNDALSIPVVLYGNRNFDDALIELRDILEDDGLHSIAGGAFIGEHSFSKVLGANRPDKADLFIANDLALLAAKRVLALEAAPTSPVFVKGESPVRPYYTPRDRQGNPVNILKVKPKTSDSCVHCGLCAKICPLGSISHEDHSTITGVCMKCGGCVKKCPVGAKYYDDEKYLYHQHELEEGFTRRAVPEIF